MSAEPVLAQTGEVFVITVDESLYSRDAVLRTCYWFTDRCYVFVRRPDQGFLEIQLKSKRPTLENPRPTSLEEIAGEFLNSLLDHQIRQDIETRTGSVRQLLVAKAFAEAGVLDDAPPGDPYDPVDASRVAGNG